MFDMGFLPDINRIIALLAEDRQNLLFSATMPKEIRRLANELLQDPHVVELDHTRPLETIEHVLYPVEEGRKLDLLQHVLSRDDFVSAIVFTRTKHRAKRLAQKLDRSGHKAVALQGNMSQGARVRAMDGFRKRTYDVLVATDIAARGLDIQHVSHVVNYDIPNTFVTADDQEMVRQVERRIGSTIPRCKVDGIESIPLPLETRRATSRRPRTRARNRPRAGTGVRGGTRSGTRPGARAGRRAQR